MHPYVYCNIIYNSKDMEASQVSINRWMDKEDVRYIMEYYSAIKKNENLPFATVWMDLEGVMLSEISLGKTNTIWCHSHVEFKKQNKQWKKETIQETDS